MHANETLLRWLGHGQLVGKRLADFLTMGGKIFHQTHWLPLLQLQGSIAEVQLDLLHADGHALPALVNAMARHEGSDVFHDLAVFPAADRRKYERELLAEKKRAQESLESERKAQVALEQAAQQRAIFGEQLVGIVSHDLRTPLSVIILGANVLASNEMSPVQSRTLARMTAAANRATRLIADLLDFTQSRLGGGLKMQKSESDLHGIVADAADELKAAWPGRMIEHRQLGAGLAYVDPDRFVQIVTNLASNALTYGTAEREVTITSSMNEHRATVSVHNWGPTIPTTLRQHIFEPLRRGEHQVKLGSRSVGLGLYIVQEISLAHGGTVELESSEAEGTTFTVTVPRQRHDI